MLYKIPMTTTNDNDPATLDRQRDMFGLTKQELYDFVVAYAKKPTGLRPLQLAFSILSDCQEEIERARTSSAQIDRDSWSNHARRGINRAKFIIDTFCENKET